ncbi:hypothetical protein DL767_008868 [Monosporascus sp. MG133]|nr:hypothetical protein DL767_008868 [Monosporascus sp. MG133]
MDPILTHLAGVSRTALNQALQVSGSGGSNGDEVWAVRILGQSINMCLSTRSREFLAVAEHRKNNTDLVARISAKKRENGDLQLQVESKLVPFSFFLLSETTRENIIEHLENTVSWGEEEQELVCQVQKTISKDPPLKTDLTTWGKVVRVLERMEEPGRKIEDGLWGFTPNAKFMKQQFILNKKFEEHIQLGPVDRQMT